VRDDVVLVARDVVALGDVADQLGRVVDQLGVPRGLLLGEAGVLDADGEAVGVVAADAALLAAVELAVVGGADVPGLVRLLHELEISEPSSLTT
jgi:hypothetical protein